MIVRLLWWSSLLCCAFPARAQQAAPASPASNQPDKPVVLTARDSLVFVFSAAGDTATATGDAKITYGALTLDAYRVQVLLGQDELRAQGLATDTGLVGRPQFKQEGQQFSSDQIAFNLKTERGRFQDARTQLDDGFLRARVVKVDKDSTLYVRQGVYTTCPCVDDPSYSLRSDRMKVQDKWIYTGPIQLFLFNIPTPLWLPFGVLPNVEGRRAGPLAPQYGEDERGFYLRDFGWYWPLSDFADLQLRGGFWTRGSWEVKPTFRYNRRYYYSGQLAVTYGRNNNGERTDLNFSSFSTTAIVWSHNQQFGQRAGLNSNVNLSSRSFLRTASESFNDRVTQNVSSSVNYNVRWPDAGRSATLSLSQQQQVQSGSVNLTLPTLTLSQNERRPFRRRGAADDPSLLGSVSYRYSGNLSNRFAFQPLPDTTLARRGDAEAASFEWFDALFSPRRYRRATGQTGTGYTFKASHNVPVNASVQVEKLPLVGALRATLVPNFDYREDWFLQTRRQYVDTAGVVRTALESGFFALRQFNTSVSMNTTIYGLFPLRVSRYDGLRHTIRPSVGFAYRPDFYGGSWGYTRRYTDAQGRQVRYPIVQEVQGGKVAGLTFSMDNVFETRRVETDTAGASRRQPVTLLNVNVNTAYNFAADSMRLSNISLSARSRLFGQVDVNLNSTFTPYGIGPRQAEPVFNLSRFRLARLTSLTLSARTSLQSRRVGAPRPSQRAQFEGFAPGDQPGGPFDPLDPTQRAAATIGVAPYADFSIPWSLTADLSYGLSRYPRQRTIAGEVLYDLRTNRNAILNTTLDFSLTPRWKVQTRSGYDFLAGEVTTSNLAILRDFDCWEMSFSWVPFGTYQSYSFTLQVKSGKLRELLRLQQPRQDVRGRFSGMLN